VRLSSQLKTLDEMKGGVSYRLVEAGAVKRVCDEDVQPDRQLGSALDCRRVLRACEEVGYKMCGCLHSWRRWMR
jgi:hypothetical protein